MYKPPNLTDRCWDFLEILSVNGNKGMTTREIVEYSKLMGVYDIPDDIQIVSGIAYEFRKRRKIPLLETIDEKHYLLDSAVAALNANSKLKNAGRQKDAGIIGVDVASGEDITAIIISEADALSFDFAPSIPPENNPLTTLGEIMDVEEILNEILPEENLPTLGQLSRYINSKPEEPEEIEILDVEQTLAKSERYPVIANFFNTIIDWLDAEVAAKTVFIEDKGRKIATLSKIASFPLFDQEVREKLQEIAADLEKLTSIE